MRLNIHYHLHAKIQRWLVHYTRACAEDYLARVYAHEGDWLVHVYRLLDDERRHIVSIRMHWNGHESNGQVGAELGLP